MHLSVQAVGLCPRHGRGGPRRLPRAVGPVRPEADEGELHQLPALLRHGHRALLPRQAPAQL